MRFYCLLACSLLLAGCSYLGDLSPKISTTITEVANTEEGVRVTFTVDTDGGEVELAGASIDRDSTIDFLENQGLASTDGTDYEVLLTGSDDGVQYVQAFAVVDGFYALSEVMAVEVISSQPDLPCAPPINSMRAYQSQCDAGDLNIRTTDEGPADTYEVTGTCSRQGRVYGQVKLQFPRNPTSGVYRVISSTPFSGNSRDKIVFVQLQVGMFLTNVAAGQEVYVQRQGDRSLITLCDLDFPYQTIRSNITARLSVPQ